MPINPLYYNESPGPQLVRDVMYKAPYEYLEKGEMAKAQTQAITKHTVNLLDSMLNTPALASKEPELQASNALYREKIDALTQNVSGGTVTLETKNQIRNLARQLSDDIKYGDRSVWATQYGAKNAFIQNNIGLAKSDPALYQAALTQMENKLVSTNDKDELVDLSTVTLSASPTFGLDDAANLARFNDLLKRQSQSFYDTDKNISDNAMKAYIKTIVSSNPTEVRKFVENYMKSIPGYGAYLASLEFANTGKVEKNPLYGQEDDIWNPTHPYYNEAKAVERALTSYASSLASNPGYAERRKAAQEAEDEVDRSAKVPGLPLKTRQVVTAAFANSNTIAGGNKVRSAVVRHAGSPYLFDPNAPKGNKPFDINKAGNPWDLAHPMYKNRQDVQTQNQNNLDRFTQAIPDFKQDDGQDKEGNPIPNRLKYDKTKLGQEIATAATNAFNLTSLYWNKDEDKNKVTDLTKETWDNLEDYVYNAIKDKYPVFSKMQLKNLIRPALKSGLAPAVSAMRDTRIIMDNSEMNFYRYPVSNTIPTGLETTQNKLLQDYLSSYADMFVALTPVEKGEANTVSLADFYKENNIISVNYRNAPNYMGALSYSVSYKPKGAKKDEGTETTTVILKDIETPRGIQAFMDFGGVDLKYGHMKTKIVYPDATSEIKNRKDVTDPRFASFKATLSQGFPVKTIMSQDNKDYVVQQYQIILPEETWRFYGANEVAAKELVKYGVLFDNTSDEITVPASMMEDGESKKMTVSEFFDSLQNLQSE